MSQGLTGCRHASVRDEKLSLRQYIVEVQPGPNGDGGWDVVTHGGRTPTGRDVVEWAEQVCALGAGEILLTSMDRDGTQSGYDLDLLRAVGTAVPVPVIASGGVGTLEHLCAGATEGGASGLLAASIFHFRQHTVQEAKALLAAHGVTVRPPSPVVDTK